MEPRVTTATEAPNQNERAICWHYRDQYFRCLDQLNLNHPVEKRARQTEQGTFIIDPLDASACESLRESFLQHCPLSWYQYFLKKREREIAQAHRISELEKKHTKSTASASTSASSWFSK